MRLPNLQRPRSVRLDDAFTLVEMLVVGAVIGVLGALLLPALVGAKERGRRAVCLGNQHQFYLTLALYGHDQQDRLAPGYSSVGEHQLRDPMFKGPSETSDLPPGLDEHVVLLAHSTRTNLVRIAGGEHRFLVCPGLGAPFNTRQGFDFYKDYGVVIGYSYLGGHGGTPWEAIRSTANLWTSPQRFSDDPRMPLLADLNVWSPSERITFAPHAARGPVMKRGDPRNRGTGVPSSEIGAVGGNVGLLDGSSNWKPIRQMKTYRGSRLFGEDGAFAAW